MNIKTKYNDWAVKHPVASGAITGAGTVAGILILATLNNERRVSAYHAKTAKVDLKRREMLHVREGLEWQLHCEDKILYQRRLEELHQSSLLHQGVESAGNDGNVRPLNGKK